MNVTPPADFRFDDSDRPRLRIDGEAAARFLQGFCTADMEKLAAGESTEAFFPSVKGRVIGYGIIFRDETGFETALFAPDPTAVHEHLQKYAVLDPVTVTSVDVERTLVAATAEGDEVIRRWPVGGLVEVAGRSGHSDATAWEGLRVAFGLPAVGADLTEKNIVQEAARTEFAVSFAKGCYLGQEPIARLDAMGHTNKELRVLRFDGVTAAKPGDAVHHEGAEAGQITSVADWEGKTIALAILKTVANAAGTVVQTAGSPATVALPTA